MRWGYAALILVAVLCGGVLLWRSPSAPSSDLVVQELPSPAQKNSVVSIIQKQTDTTPTVAPAVVDVEKVWSDFAFKNDVSEFQRLQSKVFLSEDEKAQRQEWLQNRDMLASFKAVLLAPARTLEQANIQNAALDLLFESLKEDARSESLEALRQVIRDPGVENAQLSTEDRQALAEVKAEVLYRLSAEMPDLRSELQSSLPGPVSQRLWANVVAQQKSNLAESARERSSAQ